VTDDVKRDRYGRYLLPDPETGKETSWMRATTFAGTLDDSYGLTAWKLRHAVYGVSQRPDLTALAQSADPDQDKKQLDELVEKALTVAGSDARSNLGTALHKFTERLDRGEKFRIPPEYAADLAAYHKVKELGKIETRPDFIERIMITPELGVAGTTDRIVRVEGRVIIADLKTGTDLKYAWGKIAIQLAIYAHATALWNPDTGKFEAMPKVDQAEGLVIHVPAGEGRAELVWVDLVAGWEAAQLCKRVREYRKNKKLTEKTGIAA
jgi:hypothetical protein